MHSVSYTYFVEFQIEKKISKISIKISTPPLFAPFQLESDQRREDRPFSFAKID